MPACKCPICGHSEAALWRAQGAWRVYRCKECSVSFLHPRPSADALKRFYNTTRDHDYEAFFQSESAREEARSLVDALSKRREPGRLLELGSGYGVFLEEAAARGWDIQGVEISTSRVAVARERWIPTFHGTVEEARFPASSFDLIVLRKVLDHLPDPAATLAEVARLLKPGGAVYLSCPAASAPEAGPLGRTRRGSIAPDHLFHMPASGLEVLLRRAGLRAAARRENQGSGPGAFWWNALRDLGSRFLLTGGAGGPSADRRGALRLELWAEPGPAPAEARAADRVAVELPPHPVAAAAGGPA